MQQLGLGRTRYPEDRVLLHCQSNSFWETKKTLQTEHYKTPTKRRTRANIRNSWAWQGQRSSPKILYLVTFRHIWPPTQWKLRPNNLQLADILNLINSYTITENKDNWKSWHPSKELYFTKTKTFFKSYLLPKDNFHVDFR